MSDAERMSIPSETNATEGTSHRDAEKTLGASSTLESEEPLEGYEPSEPGGWDDYPLDALAIRDERRTAVDVVRRMTQGRFVMDPDFQRGFVWDIKK